MSSSARRQLPVKVHISANLRVDHAVKASRSRALGVYLCLELLYVRKAAPFTISGRNMEFYAKTQTHLLLHRRHHHHRETSVSQM